MNFYCSAADSLLRHEHDTPTIGFILCQTKDRVVAEYALRDIHKPIGVADYELTRALPANLASSLPSIESIEAEFSELSEPKPAIAPKPAARKPIISAAKANKSKVTKNPRHSPRHSQKKSLITKIMKNITAKLLPRVKSEVSPETYQTAEQAAATWPPEVIGRKPRQLL